MKHHSEDPLTNTIVNSIWFLTGQDVDYEKARIVSYIVTFISILYLITLVKSEI